MMMIIVQKCQAPPPATHRAEVLHSIHIVLLPIVWNSYNQLLIALLNFD